MVLACSRMMHRAAVEMLGWVLLSSTVWAEDGPTVLVALAGPEPVALHGGLDPAPDPFECSDPSCHILESFQDGLYRNITMLGVAAVHGNEELVPILTR